MIPPMVLRSSALVLMALGYWGLFAKGHLEEVEDLRSEIRLIHMTMELDEACSEFSPLEEVHEVREWLTEVQDFLLSDERTSAFLLKITNALQLSGLTPQFTSPSGIEEDGIFRAQEIEVTVEGAFERVMTFLAKIENSRPICRVVRLNLRAIDRPGEVVAEMSLRWIWRAGT